VILTAVRWYLAYPLSSRQVLELPAERGVDVSHRTVLTWAQVFGPQLAAELRRRRRPVGRRWFVDEVFLVRRGHERYPYRAVGEHGQVVDVLLRERRDQASARAFFAQAIARRGVRPKVVITDKLASDPPAVRRLLPGAEHRRHKGLNNRAENSHRPTRRRERVLQRSKSPAHAQQFLGPFGPISDHFRPRRHLLPAPAYHHLPQTRFATWRMVTALRAAA
jgi:putative transposase